MRLLFSLFALFMLLYSCIAQKTQPVNIIPYPSFVKINKGNFTITNKTIIVIADEGDRKAAEFLKDYLQQYYGLKLDIDKKEGKNYIRLFTKKFIRAPEKDGYTLNIIGSGIDVSGDTYAGTFYGVQSLIQLLPVLLNNEQRTTNNLSIPQLSIQDQPYFAYRGMHLDVGRHFFPVSFVKKYIDYIALHKMNYFHWHLTEDQGWRIEVKKYPELTNVGAWRNGTIIGRYPGTGNDNIRYGGFYTQDEIKEVIQYAANRFITVIPEIEMPGHSSSAIAAYPWLSCFPEKETVIPTHPSEKSKSIQGKKVQETWGVFDDVYCAGKDSTFMFLENVMDEVLELFPSKYIHVGGDECPKTNWKQCPRCQARMKSLGLKNEHELQSYFIQRMEKYLNSKGRTLIGWDEILEGGLAPNAWVMSWRGEQGGIDAATQNHNVIMTPGEYVYLDHSQTKNEDSVTIGGYTSVEKVYSYEPVPKKLDASKSKYVQGAQANVWTEYMKNTSKVEYMIFPRMSALSEILWSEPEKKNWSGFEKRLQVQFKRYELWKANYSRAYFEPAVSLLPTNNYNGVRLKVKSKQNNTRYYFGNKNKSQFNLESDSINYVLKESGVYGIRLLGKILPDNPGEQWGMARTTGFEYLFRQDIAFNFNKATGKKISITKVPNEKYPGQGGAFSLVNGVYSSKGLSYPDWLGWVGDDLEAIIDLGKVTSFDLVRMHTINQNGSWIYLPQYVEAFTSTDGKVFRSVGKSSQFVPDTLTMGWINISMPKQSSRFIKLVAKNYGTIPDNQPGAGNKAWLFADEIEVN